MERQLTIQKWIDTNGIDKLETDLGILVKPKDDLILLKYNQIESNKALSEVQESRGLILSIPDLKIVNYVFKKFFNLGEGPADQIDRNDAIVYKKWDGSLINIWHWNNEWRMSTSGVIDGNVEIEPGLTFNTLLHQAIQKVYNKSWLEFTNDLDTDCCYAFELCTPYNIVVTQHQTWNLPLLGIRNKVTLKEIEPEMCNIDWMHVCESYPLSDLEQINNTFQELDWQNEGYIVRSKTLHGNNFLRIKIKNPKYVAVHHLKGGLGLHHAMQVVKDNEIDEFLVYFSERSQEILFLERKWKQLESLLQFQWQIILNYGQGYDSMKSYALDVQAKIDKKWQGLMYKLKQNPELNINNWMCEYIDNKWIYTEFIKEFHKSN